MRSLHPVRPSLLAPALALLLVTPLAPALAQHGNGGSSKALFMKDIEALESKFLDLAGAMSRDQYTWRPMDGVRSVSEVFMLIVAENYVVPNAWGAKAPTGITPDVSLFRSLNDVTDKATVVDHLRKSFSHYKEAVGSLTDAKMHSTIQFFGSERSVNDALFAITADMHEHLGQAIAYARVNKVVPPWTARAAKN